MSNDGRYMYQQSHYDYSPYPSYDTTLQQHRQARPQHPQFQTYQGSYMPQQQPQQQQWPSENNWQHQQQQQQHYNPSFQHPQPESPYRPDIVSTPDSPQRSSYTPVSANRPRSPVSSVSPVTPPNGLDYKKLLDSYRVIIDANNTFSSSVAHLPGRAPPMDSATLERMLQAATYGAQMLDSAAMMYQHYQQPPHQQPPPPPLGHSQQQQQPPPPPPPQLQQPASPARSPLQGNDLDSSQDGGTGHLSKRQKTDDATHEGQTCLGCGATTTPEWRRGPMGPRTLCNACGLVYAKMIKKRVKETARTGGQINGQAHRPGGVGVGVSAGADDLGSSTGGGDSDDDEFSSSRSPH